MKKIRYLRNLKKIPKGCYCYNGCHIKLEKKTVVMYLHNLCPFRTISLNMLTGKQGLWCEYLNKEIDDDVKECGINI